jgi:hypothetical protein
VELPPGKSTLAVKAETAKSYALSPPVEVTRAGGGADGPRPRLFVLAIGDPASGKSADAVAQAAKDAAPKEFGEVVTRVLTGRDARPDAIAVELDKIAAQATLADTTLVYYAGAESLDPAGRYQLSPGASAMETGAVGLPASEFERRLAAIPGRLLCAIDASRAREESRRETSANFCSASAAEEGNQRLDAAASECFRQLLTEDYGVTLLRTTRRGISAVAGTSAFAQAFGEGVGGRADENQDGAVYLHELSRYLGGRVRELSAGKEAAAIQRPAGVGSFPIAQPRH